MHFLTLLLSNDDYVTPISTCGGRGAITKGSFCSGPGRVSASYSWADHFTLIVPLSTPEYR